MGRSAIVVVIFALSSVCIACGAVAGSVVNLHVNEPIGIRRKAYPATARVPFPPGILRSAACVRLMRGNTEVAAQIAVESWWPDNSIQWIDVDFDATMGPYEVQTHRLEFGVAIEAAKPEGGLVVVQRSDAIQVGNVRFGKHASPLLASVDYFGEAVGQGPNGFVVADSTGLTHELTNPDPTKVVVVKPGPLRAVLRYTGEISLDDGYRASYAITADMTRGKSWIRLSASVEDPERRFRDIAFRAPLAFEGFPWPWDFGTGSWSYGSFRSASESAILTQFVDPDDSRWRIEFGTKGQEQPYEVVGAGRPRIAEGWGHFQDATHALAFGFDKFGMAMGTYVIALDGTGLATFRFAPLLGSTRHELTLYLHYIASPPQVGAGTSPPSMLNPLVCVCDPEHYVKCGVPPPADAMARNKPMR